MLTSTQDFIDNKITIKHNFLQYLITACPELTRESTRKKVFTDATYIINNPELQLDFFNVISGKIAIEKYRNKLTERFLKANEKEPHVRHAKPESRARDYGADLLRLQRYLIKANLL